jgi:hypothetical protein
VVLVWGKGRRDEDEKKQRQEIYARKQDLEELERRATRVEARVRILEAAANMADANGGVNSG